MIDLTNQSLLLNVGKPLLIFRRGILPGHGLAFPAPSQRTFDEVEIFWRSHEYSVTIGRPDLQELDQLSPYWWSGEFLKMRR